MFSEEEFDLMRIALVISILEDKRSLEFISGDYYDERVREIERLEDLKMKLIMLEDRLKQR